MKSQLLSLLPLPLETTHAEAISLGEGGTATLALECLGERTPGLWELPGWPGQSLPDLDSGSILTA